MLEGLGELVNGVLGFEEERRHHLARWLVGVEGGIGSRMPRDEMRVRYSACGGWSCLDD